MSTDLVPGPPDEYFPCTYKCGRWTKPSGTTEAACCHVCANPRVSPAKRAQLEKLDWTPPAPKPAGEDLEDLMEDLEELGTKLRKQVNDMEKEARGLLVQSEDLRERSDQIKLSAAKVRAKIAALTRIV